MHTHKEELLQFGEDYRVQIEKNYELIKNYEEYKNSKFENSKFEEMQVRLCAQKTDKWLEKINKKKWAFTYYLLMYSYDSCIIHSSIIYDFAHYIKCVGPLKYSFEKDILPLTDRDLVGVIAFLFQITAFCLDASVFLKLISSEQYNLLLCDYQSEIEDFQVILNTLKNTK